MGDAGQLRCSTHTGWGVRLKCACQQHSTAPLPDECACPAVTTPGSMRTAGRALGSWGSPLVTRLCPCAERICLPGGAVVSASCCAAGAPGERSRLRCGWMAHGRAKLLKPGGRSGRSGCRGGRSTRSDCRGSCLRDLRTGGEGVSAAACNARERLANSNPGGQPGRLLPFRTRCALALAGPAAAALAAAALAVGLAGAPSPVGLVFLLFLLLPIGGGTVR